MPTSRSSRLLLGAVSALAVAAVSLSAEAKPAAFKPSFVAKLPGEPKSAASFKAQVKGPLGAASGYAYTDAVGQLHLVGSLNKVGLTSVHATFDAVVPAGFDLTDVTFPVSHAALVTYSWTKTVTSPKPPFATKITSFNYSPGPLANTTVTITSFDPVKGEMRGTISGDLQYNENIQDPKDDARDGKVVTMKNVKFSLKPLGG